MFVVKARSTLIPAMRIQLGYAFIFHRTNLFPCILIHQGEQLLTFPQPVNTGLFPSVIPASHSSVVPSVISSDARFSSSLSTQHLMNLAITSHQLIDDQAAGALRRSQSCYGEINFTFCLRDECGLIDVRATHIIHSLFSSATISHSISYQRFMLLGSSSTDV